MTTSTAPDAYYSRGLRERFRLDGLKLVSSVECRTYAEIEYKIDERKYFERTKAIVHAGGLEEDVPSGWPKKLEGPLVWTGSEFDGEDEYMIHLDDLQVSELQAALSHFKKLALPSHEVSRDTFPLPCLGQCLDQASNDVYEGRGFAIIRGLDPDMFTVEDFTIVSVGISSYIAERRGKQDQRGSMLMHAIERGIDEAEPKNVDKPFHTDTVCDCLALITRGCSAEGGRSILASTWTIYNELAANRPDMIHTLAKPDWPFDTYGRDPPFFNRAVLFMENGRAILNISRRLLVGQAPHDNRTPGIPGLTERQAEALDALHFIAEQNALKPTMKKGDIRFFNNMGLLHRREGFEKSSERHLIRLWLNNQHRCWHLPEPLALAWARVFDDEERGSFWDIEPVRKNGLVLRIAGSCD